MEKVDSWNFIIHPTSCHRHACSVWGSFFFVLNARLWFTHWPRRNRSNRPQVKSSPVKSYNIEVVMRKLKKIITNNCLDLYSPPMFRDHFDHDWLLLHANILHYNNTWLVFWRYIHKNFKETFDWHNYWPLWRLYQYKEINLYFVLLSSQKSKSFD